MYSIDQFGFTFENFENGNVPAFVCILDLIRGILDFENTTELTIIDYTFFYKQPHFGRLEPQIFENHSKSANN